MWLAAMIGRKLKRHRVLLGGMARVVELDVAAELTGQSKLHVRARSIVRAIVGPNSAHGRSDVVLSQLVGNVTSRKAKPPCSLGLGSASGSKRTLNDRLFE